ncbi:MAG: hypothetical protein ABSF71_10355 [Terriglobia bacterium]
MYRQEFASFLAAAVVNRVFCEEAAQPDASRFLAENRELVEKEAASLSSDNSLCYLLTCSVYLHCYSRHVQRGGKHGFLYNPYLGYIRALSHPVDDWTTYNEICSRFEEKLDHAVVEPLQSLLQLGIFRPLPRNPNARDIYSQVHLFAVSQGVKFQTGPASG